jgi:hypothetical protein
MMTKKEFWKEARRRNRWANVVWISWIILCPLLFVSYRFILGILPIATELRQLFAMAFSLGTWAVLLIWATIRFLRLRCLRCDQPAFRFPKLLFPARLKCQCCGLTEGTVNAEQVATGNGR